MNDNSVQHARSIEQQAFAQNASALLIDQGKFIEFLASLNYEVEETRKGYRGLCPACRKGFAFIGTNGTVHRIYWKCHLLTCPTNKGESHLVRNLLGLVRGLVPDGSMGTAIKTIAKFLGYEGRSYDITNGKAQAFYTPTQGCAEPPADASRPEPKLLPHRDYSKMPPERPSDIARTRLPFGNAHPLATRLNELNATDKPPQSETAPPPEASSEDKIDFDSPPF